VVTFSIVKLVNEYLEVKYILKQKPPDFSRGLTADFSLVSFYNIENLKTSGAKNK
jgi:hypothetical protein